MVRSGLELPKKYNIRFMHIADCHLGKRQYGLDQRADDFAIAFEWVCNEAIKHDVDFLLISGDLFDKRAVNAKTLKEAIIPLLKLYDNSIEVFVIEGNHDRPYYKDKLGWVEYLSDRYLVTYIPSGKSELNNGQNVEICNAEELSKSEFTSNFFHIGMLHAGVEGIIPNMNGCISKEDLNKIRGTLDYLALGHIHVRYDMDGWIYNPGSLEHWSISEWEWQGGYYLVDVNTDTKKFNVRHVPTPKRSMIRTNWKDSKYALVEIKEGSVVELTLLGETEQRPDIEWIRKEFTDTYPYILHLKIVDKTTRPTATIIKHTAKDKAEIERDTINNMTKDEKLTSLILEIKKDIKDDPEDLLELIENV